MLYAPLEVASADSAFSNPGRSAELTESMLIQPTATATRSAAATTANPAYSFDRTEKRLRNSIARPAFEVEGEQVLGWSARPRRDFSDGEAVHRLDVGRHPHSAAKSSVVLCTIWNVSRCTFRSASVNKPGCSVNKPG